MRESDLPDTARNVRVALWLLLLCSPAFGFYDEYERYGFDTWTEGWAVTTNAAVRGVTNVVQSTNWVWRGAYSLKLDCNLRTNPASSARGQVLVDMSENPPCAIEVPVNLNTNYVCYCVRYFPGASGSDPARSNRFRAFVTDWLGRSMYDSWIVIPTNSGAVDYSFLVSTSAPAGGSVDANFDPSQVRWLGLEAAVPAGSTGTYNGPLYLDQVRFKAPPGAYAPPANQRYSFDRTVDGFTPSADSGNQAFTNLSRTTTAPSNATGCLALDVHLVGTNSSYDGGEVSVDVRKFAPEFVSTPINLQGRRVSAWVHCPAGLRGPESNPNYVRLVCKDVNWKSFYGTLEHIYTGYWFSISMSPDTNAPQHGWMDPGFDPTRIREMGLSLCTGGGSTSTYDGKIYIDGFAFAADLDPLRTNDLRYGFERGTEGWTWETFAGITGVVGVAQSTNFALEATNALCLQIDIRGTGTNRQQGAAKVDMRYYPSPLTEAPYNLEGSNIRARVYCPVGSESTNPAYPNTLRLYVQSGTNFENEYGAPVAMRDGQWVTVNLTPSTNTPDGGFMQPGFSPTNIVGVSVEVDMSGTYTGALYLDFVDFPSPRIPPYPMATYGFNSWTQGWGVATDPSLRGIAGVGQATNWAWMGAHSLRLDCDLRPTASNRQGRVLVDMQASPPAAVTVPVNLNRFRLYAHVKCPPGSRGTDPANPTRFRILAGDANGRFLCDRWLEPNPDAVIDYYVVLTTNAPGDGCVDAGFDPSKIRWLGFDVGMPEGSTGVYQGPVYIDSVSFRAPPGAYAPPADQDLSFDANDEFFQVQTYHDSMAATNVLRVTGAPSNATGCLAIDLNLVGGHTNWSQGEILHDLLWYPPSNTIAPLNLFGKRVSAWVFCPDGSSGSEDRPNFVTLFCKDANWKTFNGTLEHAVTGYWTCVSMTPGTNAPMHGWMDPGFDPTQIRQVGIKIGTDASSTTAYRGRVYVDGISIRPDRVPLSDLRYGFEPSKQGWECEVWTNTTGIVAVAQSTNVHLEAARSLRCQVDIRNTGTNRARGAVKVDMYNFPPPVVRGPFHLEGQPVRAHVYCPPGTQGSATNPNTMRFFVKGGTNWAVEYGAPVALRDGQWILVGMAPGWTNPAGGYVQAGFSPTNIVSLGVEIEMSGTYTGALYVDHVAFPAAVPPMPDSQHTYDFETNGQTQWSTWATDPAGWQAYAWTNVYYATNAGYAGSVARAADAVFAGTNASFELRKGVFLLEYNPPLNLSTKDHRKIQCKVKFEPPLEGLMSFDASLNVFDKITDQWYFKTYKIGGSDYNILEFDLANSNEYAASSPRGPMDVSSIGFLSVQIFANMAWTGTVYLDDVVVGGRERGTDYDRVRGGFMRSAGTKFVIDGTNFYHAGANIEYLFSVSDAVCEELLDLATNLHLQVVRTWAFHEGQPYSFQPKRGVWNEPAFEHLDRIVAMAGHRGIRLMLGLLDNWGHNGGMYQYMNWVYQEHPESVDTNLTPGSVMYHDQYYTNQWCRQWYRDFVTKLLNRTNSITGRLYKEDPTVVAWEIVNEPRCESVFNGSTIHEWTHTMSDWVRTVDTNHLLGGGQEGGYVKTYDEADAVPWETYVDNYYHYGVHGWGESGCNESGCGRGHGVDFVSDHRSEPTLVRSQGGTYSNREPVVEEWRSGNSNINFCTCRIYVDQREYNLWRTNFNSSDQRLEWINDHWYDAHTQIGKPLILEEFGIHSIGWIYNGSFGEVQIKRTPAYTQADRVNVYDLYYRHVESLGLAASFFWNLGYKGMWDDPYETCEATNGWFADPWSPAATGLATSTNHVLQGSNALEMAWNVTNAADNKAIFLKYTNEQWVVRVVNGAAKGINRIKFTWNIYNPAAEIHVALALRGTADWKWVETPTRTLTTGWNKVVFDLSGSDWKGQDSGWQHTLCLLDTYASDGKIVLEDVRQIGLLFYDLPVGAGAAYVDKVSIRRDDGFVIFAEDPVCDVIRGHADRMRAKNVPTNAPANHAPVASNATVTADAFVATRVNLGGSDADGDRLSYRIIQKPTNGWVFGSPPTNIVYKSKPGTEGGDTFTYKVYDGRLDSAEAVVTVNIGSTDVDQDGIPDAWEYRFFPANWQYPYPDNLTNLCGLCDWDRDGANDWEEYRAGTAPNTVTSCFWVGESGAISTNKYVIQWSSVAGKTYRVERTTNLMNGFSVLASSLAATPPMNTYTDATANGRGMYLYRIKLQ